MSQAKILCVCRDDAIKERRCMALTAEGYETVGTTVVKHAAQLLASERFDLVVVGVSIPTGERNWLASISVNTYGIPALLAWEGKSDDEGEEVLRIAVASLLTNRRPAGHQAIAARAGG